MGRGTLGEVRDGSVDPWGSTGWVGDPREGPGQDEVPTRRFWMGQMTLEEVLDRFWDPRGGQGWVGGPTRRFWTGRGMLEEVQDGSENPWGCLGLVGDP